MGELPRCSKRVVMVVVDTTSSLLETSDEGVGVSAKPPRHSFRATEGWWWAETRGGLCWARKALCGAGGVQSPLVGQNERGRGCVGRKHLALLGTRGGRVGSGGSTSRWSK